MPPMGLARREGWRRRELYLAQSWSAKLRDQRDGSCERRA